MFKKGLCPIHLVPYARYFFLESSQNYAEDSMDVVDNFTYIGSNISSTECDVNMQRLKEWTDIDRLSIIEKSDLPDKIKRDFFQAVFVAILL